MINRISGGQGQDRTLILDGLLFGVTHSINEDRPTIYAARYTNLGLTAYGDNEEEAIANLDNALSLYAHKLLRKGTLYNRLTQAGVRWHWQEPIPGWAWVTEPEDDGHPTGSVTGKVLVHI